MSFSIIINQINKYTDNQKIGFFKSSNRSKREKMEKV